MAPFYTNLIFYIIAAERQIQQKDFCQGQNRRVYKIPKLKPEGLRTEQLEHEMKFYSI